MQTNHLNQIFEKRTLLKKSRATFYTRWFSNSCEFFGLINWNQAPLCWIFGYDFQVAGVFFLLMFSILSESLIWIRVSFFTFFNSCHSIWWRLLSISDVFRWFVHSCGTWTTEFSAMVNLIELLINQFMIHFFLWLTNSIFRSDETQPSFGVS